MRANELLDIKKHGIAVLFYVRIISWGYPPQTWTQGTFREKSFVISKAFVEIKWCVRQEFLLPTFLIRKVGGTPLFQER